MQMQWLAVRQHWRDSSGGKKEPCQQDMLYWLGERWDCTGTNRRVAAEISVLWWRSRRLLADCIANPAIGGTICRDRELELRQRHGKWVGSKDREELN